MWSKYKGTGVALVTPFHDDGSIDFKCLEKLVVHLTQNGVNYLVVQGTTGESATLSQDEKSAVLSCITEVNQGRLPVVLGIGGNNTQQVLSLFNKWDLTGVDAILSVSPYYNKPTQEGIYRHYKQIAQESPLPVILYNVPSRTGSNVNAETTLRLAHDFNNIIAIKEASGDFVQISTIIRDKPNDFIVISGDDALTLPLLSIGAEGVISVIANALPREFSELVSSALQADYNHARAIHLQLVDVINLLFKEGSPAGVKAALKILGVCNHHNVRLPLVSISDNTYDQLEAALARVNVSVH